MSALAERALALLQEPDERSKQKLIGASQIGGCPYCLGYALLGEEPPEPETPSWLLKASQEGTTGLAAFVGTGVHKYIEHILGEKAEDVHIEQRVDIYNLEGYGVIRGNIDAHDGKEIVDWKVVGDWSYKNMALEWRLNPQVIPTKQYRVQQMAYAYGLRQLGYDIQQVSLVVFKKTSNAWTDVQVYTETYNQEVVDNALYNLEFIYGLVRQGNVEDLPSDENCYNCSKGF